MTCCTEAAKRPFSSCCVLLRNAWFGEDSAAAVRVVLQLHGLRRFSRHTPAPVTYSRSHARKRAFRGYVADKAHGKWRRHGPQFPQHSNEAVAMLLVCRRAGQCELADRQRGQRGRGRRQLATEPQVDLAKLGAQRSLACRICARTPFVSMRAISRSVAPSAAEVSTIW